MADQFENGESVDHGNLAYLRDFSDASHTSYDWLMNQVANMYGVTPRDAAHEAPVTPQTAMSLGGVALTSLL